ncbi:MAG TPA: hypothetical protein VKX39_16615 [Bryobacteraceae bacterium]|nr:hypothetical protein [Bryobacteraceae bacterium]
MARGIFLSLAFLISAMLAMGAYQCATACVDDVCTPPCHAHSHAPLCAHQAQRAVLVKSPQPVPQPAALSGISEIEVPAQSVAHIPLVFKFTLRAILLTSPVLRI